MKRLLFLLMATCILPAMVVHAASEFTVLRRSSIFIGDDSGRTSLVVAFTLPATVDQSATVANSAILDLAVSSSQFDYNELYINSPTIVCAPENADPNQPASIGMLNEHDESYLSAEWVTTHLTFSSALLLPGANTLLICPRTVTGDAGVGVGNLDDFEVRGIVLHYHTTP